MPLELLYSALLTTVLRYEVPVLDVDSVSLGQTLVEVLDFLPLHVVLSAFLFDYVLLPFVGLDQFVDLADLFLAGIVSFLELIFLLLYLN